MPAQYDAAGNFLGFRHLRDHRTVGPHRALCSGCRGEWCYPDAPCPCCLPASGFSCPHCGGSGRVTPTQTAPQAPMGDR